MRPIESLSHGEALWELVETADEEALNARRHLRQLLPGPSRDWQSLLEQLPDRCARFVVLSIATTRATGLLALAFRGASHEEIARYAREIPEPAGRLARRWARDDWGYWRRRPGPADAGDVPGQDAGGG